MAFDVIGIGAAANDGTGDPLRTAFGKANNNVGGASASAGALVAWVEAGAYEATAISFDSDGVVTTATVKWPDGSAGTFTTTAKDTTHLAVNSYTVSHTDSGKTVTQAAVTRDADGNVTTKPALSVA